MTGTLARVGIRGRRPVLQCVAPSPVWPPLLRQPKALKELGVETADASGKMRRPFDILLDLQKRVSRFGEVDQVSFFKDIAGERVLRVSSRWSTAQVMATSSHSMNKLLKRIKSGGLRRR